MAGYSGTPLVEKLGIKENMSVTLIHPPKNYMALIGGLPRGAKVRELGPLTDFVHLFTTSLAELGALLPKLKKSLASSGMLWISWPKKSANVESDVGEHEVRELGLAAGLVDVKVCAVDDTWSGLKFVYRLKDRT